MVNGQERLACQTIVDCDMLVVLPQDRRPEILTQGVPVQTAIGDPENRYAVAIDVGTTTVVVYLLDGRSGEVLADASCMNPQIQYGADVISRIQYALDGGADALKEAIHLALGQLLRELAVSDRIPAGETVSVAIAGNTAMHHLLLGIAPESLVVPPYMPKVTEALELPAEELLPVRGTVRMLPNIAGFVGGDTVACMVATRFDQLDELTLLLDIGTNGELVLGDRRRRIACSTAVGPAFEGAKISCGMRGVEGAVDHVTLDHGRLMYHVIGDGAAVGLCGSGLLDLVAVLLDTGIIDGSGLLEGGAYQLEDTTVVLTQKDVREVQLAKAAIRAGIELLTQKLGVSAAEIRRVYLAGAFGSYLTPASACRIGMIPPVLLDRIQSIGNAAGEGVKLCALNGEEFAYSQKLAEGTEFLELAVLPQFQDCYVDALEFSEETDDPI